LYLLLLRLLLLRILLLALLLLLLGVWGIRRLFSALLLLLGWLLFRITLLLLLSHGTPCPFNQNWLVSGENQVPVPFVDTEGTYPSTEIRVQTECQPKMFSIISH
jgi:hypothetical protein